MYIIAAAAVYIIAVKKEVVGGEVAIALKIIIIKNSTVVMMEILPYQSYTVCFSCFSCHPILSLSLLFTTHQCKGSRLSAHREIEEIEPSHQHPNGHEKIRHFIYFGHILV